MAPTRTDEADLFAPPAQRWERLSPRYVVVRRAGAAFGWTLATAAVAVGLQVALGRPELTGAVVAAGLAWTAWRIVRVRRWVASWGWAERDADLCITRGLWTRHLTVVPLGRMQVVKVTAGPLARWQGLASVQLVTAAMQTDATIPGLAHADAVALRDRLIELSDARGAGL